MLKVSGSRPDECQKKKKKKEERRERQRALASDSAQSNPLLFIQ